MMNTVIKEIQGKLYEKLRKSGWANPLKTFLLGHDFEKILTVLYEKNQGGVRFTPTLKQVFRAFEECPYKDLRVVFIGQDPYPQFGVADGIAFSCSNTGKTQASLRMIFNEIERTVYPEGFSRDPDLTRWANQGILMLNTALTCEVGKPETHLELWKPFMTFLFELLSAKDGLIFVFLGKKAQEWNSLLSNKHLLKFFVSHPAAGLYDKVGWNCADLFNNINKIITRSNGEQEQIIW